jgi:hypothetical protein
MDKLIAVERLADLDSRPLRVLGGVLTGPSRSTSCKKEQYQCNNAWAHEELEPITCLSVPKLIVLREALGGFEAA